VRLRADGRQTVNLLLAHPTSLDLVWSYARRFCCEQLFRDQKSGVFQLAGSGLCIPTGSGA